MLRSRIALISLERPAEKKEENRDRSVLWEMGSLATEMLGKPIKVRGRSVR
jgi:hypothetical protein